jgi:hypothetical protein
MVQIGGIGKVTEHLLRDVLGITTCEDMLKNSALLCALFSDLSSGQYVNLTPTLIFLLPFPNTHPVLFAYLLVQKMSHFRFTQNFSCLQIAISKLYFHSDFNDKQFFHLTLTALSLLLMSFFYPFVLPKPKLK